MRTTAENFIKIVQTSRPCEANLCAKFEILAVLQAVFPHFCPDEHEKWHGGAGFPVPNFTFIGATCRPCGVKPSFGPLSKTIRTWLYFVQACW